MKKNLVAKTTATIDAPDTEVWHALVSPAVIREYMFGATVQSSWRVGSRITWSGTFKGKPFEDKGEILQIESPHLLQYTHYSAASGKSDVPEHYHIVTIEVVGDGGPTTVNLSQDGNTSDSERLHSQKNWDSMLAGLKAYVEAHTHAGAY